MRRPFKTTIKNKLNGKRIIPLEEILNSTDQGYVIFPAMGKVKFPVFEADLIRTVVNDVLDGFNTALTGTTYVGKTLLWTCVLQPKTWYRITGEKIFVINIFPGRYTIPKEVEPGCLEITAPNGYTVRVPSELIKGLLAGQRSGADRILVRLKELFRFEESIGDALLDPMAAAESFGSPWGAINVTNVQWLADCNLSAAKDDPKRYKLVRNLALESRFDTWLEVPPPSDDFVAFVVGKHFPKLSRKNVNQILAVMRIVSEQIDNGLDVPPPTLSRALAAAKRLSRGESFLKIIPRVFLGALSARDAERADQVMEQFNPKTKGISA